MASSSVAPRYRAPEWVPVLLALAGVGWLYAETLKHTISGCPTDFCLDVGEIQIALATWGTIHHTGYPLYMLIGSPFVALARLLGATAAEGAAWYSLVTMLTAVGLAYGLYRDIIGSRWLAAASAAVLAVLPGVWLHGVIPEVYALHMVFVVAVLWLTVRLRRRWSDRWGWALALIGGLGVAHHRLLAPMLVVCALVLVPGWFRSPRRWRWLAGAAGLFVAGFLPYVDLPLRAMSGGVWLYDRPDTWAGFWRVFLGTEASNAGFTEVMPGGLGVSAGWVFGELAQEFTPAVAILIVVATVVALTSAQRRSDAAVLVAFELGALTFSLVLYRAVLLAATHLPVFLASVGLVGLGLQTAGEDLSRHLRRTANVAAGAAVAVVVGLALFRAAAAYPEVIAVTQDDRYERLVRATDAHLRAPAGSVLMEPWGQPYFALAYHRLIDHGLADVVLVDHRADLGALAGVGPVFTLETTLYTFGFDWWQERFGPELRVNSAGGGWVTIGPATTAPTGAAGIKLGDGILLLDVVPEPVDADGVMNVRVDWSAESAPTEDYSTYVHASDQIIDDITDPAQQIAGSDSQAPVYGRAPTRTWRPGELIREDHALTLPSGMQPQSLFVGMYRQTPDGKFVRLGQARWVLSDGRWLRSTAGPAGHGNVQSDEVLP